MYAMHSIVKYTIDVNRYGFFFYFAFENIEEENRRIHIHKMMNKYATLENVNISSSFYLFFFLGMQHITQGYFT